MKSIFAAISLLVALSGCVNLYKTPAEMRAGAAGHLVFAASNSYEKVYRNVVGCARAEWEGNSFKVHSDLYADGTALVTVGAFSDFVKGIGIQIEISGDKDSSRIIVYYLNDAWKVKAPLVEQWAESGDKNCATL